MTENEGSRVSSCRIRWEAASKDGWVVALEVNDMERRGYGEASSKGVDQSKVRSRVKRGMEDGVLVRIKPPIDGVR
jgi:hypothetical protein